MSAAIWSEPADAHERIGRVSLPPEGLSGRVKRDTIRVHVWGATQEDREAAEADARGDQRLTRYRIEIVQADGAATSKGARGEIAHDVQYGRTWIAFRA